MVALRSGKVRGNNEDVRAASEANHPSSDASYSVSETHYPAVETHYPSSEDNYPASEVKSAFSETHYPASEDNLPASDVSSPTFLVLFGSAFKRYCDQTTLHGYSYLYRDADQPGRNVIKSSTYFEVTCGLNRTMHNLT
jgi:hypothetical protein